MKKWEEVGDEWRRRFIARLKWAPAYLCILAITIAWMLNSLGGCVRRW